MCDDVRDLVNRKAEGNFLSDLHVYQADEEYENLLSKAANLHEEMHDHDDWWIENSLGSLGGISVYPDEHIEEAKNRQQRFREIREAIQSADEGDVSKLEDIQGHYEYAPPDA